jgi:hypothetical protein
MKSICSATPGWRRENSRSTGGKPVQADVVAGAYGERPGDMPGEIADGTFRIGHVLKDAPCARQQLASALGGCHQASDAVEQAYAELLFQQGNALADGRLCQVQAITGQRKRAAVGDRDKGLQLLGVHE